MVLVEKIIMLYLKQPRRVDYMGLDFWIVSVLHCDEFEF
jgi:hypothetical protein